ncbi:MAG TPA: biotin/lipoyl-containing protein [Candidatus Limnocylindrales bacterium]|nr:biotin/lipoyl-containing protein [Candidatus Limnocylindrales bacterium]
MTDDVEPRAVGPGPGGAADPAAGTTPADPAAVDPAAGADPAAAADPVAGDPVPAPPRDRGDVELLRLIDRLAALLDRSDLTELEVEAGDTGLILRKPAALVAVGAAASPGSAGDDTVSGASAQSGQSTSAAVADSVTAPPSVKAPLTGIFYASPAPGSGPYVAVGGEVAVGQVIGLIEAMKLFNEIKSDLAGRVVRVVADSGTLVKAKQPLIEVEPL